VVCQRDRYQLLQQAAQKTVRILPGSPPNTCLAAKASAAALQRLGRSFRQARLIKDKSAERQILSIYDDRIQTEQQLATVYGKWSAQVLLQHQIVLHLLLQSLALILFIAVCMVLCDAWCGI